MPCSTAASIRRVLKPPSSGRSVQHNLFSGLTHFKAAGCRRSNGYRRWLYPQAQQAGRLLLIEQSSRTRAIGSTTMAGCCCDGGRSSSLDDASIAGKQLPFATMGLQVRGSTDLGSLQGHPSRCIGAILGCMCGDILGAAVEGRNWVEVRRLHPALLCDFQETERGFGCYTDDSQMTLALARSLVETGRSSAEDAAIKYAFAFEAHRGYGAAAGKIMQALQNGNDYRKTATSEYPEGSFANGGAMRIAPVGLAYRNAPVEVLHKAVCDALLCTHVHPDAVDGAFIQAAAVAALCKSSPAGDGPAGTPEALLAHLIPLARTEGLQAKLTTLLQRLHRPQGTPAAPGTPSRLRRQALRDSLKAADAATTAPHPATMGSQEPTNGIKRSASGSSVSSAAASGPATANEEGAAAEHGASAQNWEGDPSSEEWAADLEVLAQVSEPFQIRATDAVACALRALTRHWSCPEAAIIGAVHYGGDTDTVAAMAGAMAGALHGAAWVPKRWWKNIENGGRGRDPAVHVALQLAELDVQA